MCRAVWIDTISGDFLVASPKVGALRIYNAAIPVCKEIIKVSRHGIYDVQRMTNEVYLLKLKNGQIMQFNIKTKKELFMGASFLLPFYWKDGAQSAAIPPF